MKRVVIFDFDGTIADTFPVVLDIFHKVQKRPVALNKEEEILMRGAALMQVRLRSVFKAASHLGVPYWRLPFIFGLTQVLLKKRMHEVQPFAGMPELITSLKKDKVGLFIVSANSKGNIRRFLKVYDLEDEFVRIYGNIRPQGKAKVIRRIVRSQKTDANHVRYVGDEGRDITAGHAAEVPTVAVTWGYNTLAQLADAQPGQLANNSRELARALEVQ